MDCGEVDRACIIVASAPSNMRRMRAMAFCRVLSLIGLLVALVGIAFFAIGIADGTVSTFSVALWPGLLGRIAAG
jgi:hypothetical protein